MQRKIAVKEFMRKNWELLLAFFFFVCIFIGVWVEFTLFHFDLYTFFVIVNLNLLLLIISGFIVVRKFLQLLIDRRKKILGSHLRFRVVSAFIVAALIPAIFIFFIFSRIVSTSVNYWFSSQVEYTLEQANVLGQIFFGSVTEKLKQQAKLIIVKAEEGNTWDTMEPFIRLYNTADMHTSVVRDDFTPIIPLDATDRSFLALLYTMHDALYWKKLTQTSFLQEINGEDYIIYIESIRYIPSAHWDASLGPALPKEKVSVQPGLLIIAQKVGKGFFSAQMSIRNSIEEYKKIRVFRDPIKYSLFYLIGILTFAIILGSVWYGLRIAKEITAPIVDLAQAFTGISRGNLDVRLDKDVSTEEMEQLFIAFNDMAQQLATSHAEIMRTNAHLENTNKELALQKAHIETILETITAGVVLLDSNWCIQSINKPGASILRFDAIQNILNKRIDTLLPSTLQIFFNDMSSALLNGAMRWQRDIVVTIRGVERTLMVVAVPLHTSTYNGTILVFDDITDLDKNYRMEAWREVARRMAHEIKNPLTPIKLSAQRIMKRYANTEDTILLQSSQQIVQQVEYLQEFVSEFSRFAKLPEIVRTRGNIVDVVTEQVAFFQTMYPNITFDISIQGTIPTILLDVVAMQRVFMNLLKNAVEALEQQKEPLVLLTISFDEALCSVMVTVTDNGIGIPQEALGRLFEPYFSSKKEGTGLGLAIVQSIITDHRGYIRVRSSERGTTMTITLPVA